MVSLDQDRAYVAAGESHQITLTFLNPEDACYDTTNGFTVRVYTYDETAALTDFTPVEQTFTFGREGDPLSQTITLNTASSGAGKSFTLRIQRDIGVVGVWDIAEIRMQ